MTKHVDTTTVTRNAKAAPILPITDENGTGPLLQHLAALTSFRADRVTPSLVALTEAHAAAFAASASLREVPSGELGHEEWEAECAKLENAEGNAMLALLRYEARRNADTAYRAKYLMAIDKQSAGIFRVYAGAGPALLQSMANAENPATAEMLSVAFDTSGSKNPEVQMSWLVRAYRDAAMLIDPTICGCWVGNNVNFTPEGGTTIFSVAFDRGEGLGMTRRQGDAGVRRSYLTDDVENVTFPHLPDLSALSGVDLHTLYSFYSCIREHFELLELGDMGRTSSPAQAFIEQWVDGVFGVYADIGRYAVSSDRTDLNNLRARYIVDFAEGPVEVSGPGVPDLGQAA